MHDNYEFNEAQDATFKGLATWVAVVGVAVLVFGGVSLARGIMDRDWTHILGGAVGLLLAVFLSVAWAAARRIVNTKGHDMEHAMRALRTFRLYFAVQIVTIIGLLAGAINTFLRSTGH